jgi:hypothetical protein
MRNEYFYCALSHDDVSARRSTDHLPPTWPGSAQRVRRERERKESLRADDCLCSGRLLSNGSGEEVCVTMPSRARGMRPSPLRQWLQWPALIRP